MNEGARKETLKRLRAERAAWAAKAAGTVKAQSADIKAILAQMTGEGATVPEIAEATGMPAGKVLWYVSALRKYGRAFEGEKDGDYFRYLAGGAGEPDSDACGEE